MLPRMRIQRIKTPYVFLWLTPLALMAPAWAAGKALFWGTPLLQFIPWWTFAWETLLAGHLPLWNPYVGMGAPLLANYQSALFYPGSWVYFGLFVAGGVRWMAWGQAVMIAMHLAWAALGMARLAGRLGMGRFAQVAAGLAFGLSGYLTARASFLSINAAAAWLPWIVLCLTGLIDSLQSKTPPLRWFLALSASVTIQLLTGHAQTAWYSLTLAGIWGVFYAWARGSVDRRAVLTVRATAGLGMAVLLAAAASAAQLLPTAEYLAQSQRSSAVAYDYALNYSFWPWRLITLFAPGMFGSPVNGDYWGFGNYWEDAVYIGLLPLLLATSALFAGFRRTGGPSEAGVFRRRLTVFLAALIAAAFVLALGSNTPLYPWLYRHIPTFAMFQAPTRWTLLAEFALALLAGLGADAWRRPIGRSLYWTRLGAMGAFAILIGAGLGWLVLGSVSPTFVRAAAMLGLFSLGAMLLSLNAPDANCERDQVLSAASGPWSSWHTAAAMLIAFDLLVASWGLNPAGPLELYDPSPAAAEVKRLANGGRLYIPPGQERSLKYDRFLVFETFDPGEARINLRLVNLPNANMLDRIAGVNQYDPLTPAAYAAWMEMLETSSAQKEGGLLRLMDVGVIERISLEDPLGVALTAVERGGRAGVAPCGVWVENTAEAREMLMAELPQLAETIILSRQPGAPTDIGCEPAEAWLAYPPAVQLELEDGKLNPNRLVINADLPASGWVWVADTWFPGWKAFIDGEETAIAQANGLFRAVPVGKGEHRIVMEYKPNSFYAGLVISLIGLLIFGMVWWRSR